MQKENISRIPLSLTHGRSEFCVGTGADVRKLRGDRHKGQMLRGEGDSSQNSTEFSLEFCMGMDTQVEFCVGTDTNVEKSLRNFV